MKLFLHIALVTLAAMLLPRLGIGAASDGYPNKPIRFIAPFPPGGTVEVLARAIGVKMTESWGRPVIIDNRPGASGIIGSEMAAKAPPDGYTLLMVPVTHATNSSLYSKVPYDPIADFTPISLAGSQPLMVVVNPSLPVKSIAELIAFAKAKPGQLNYGSSGNGTSQHLATELFKSMTKVDLVHVPYKGSAAALTDVISGQLSVMFPQMVTAISFAKSGKLRAIAVTSAKRSPAMPNLPTVAEAGVRGYESTAWFAVLGPAGMPKDLVDKIHGEIVRAVSSHDVRERLSSQGLDLIGSTPEELTEFLKTEIAKYSKLVKEIGGRLD
jgi:tripartite-type tricarboxylate transporter receptor subunit TctC